MTCPCHQGGTARWQRSTLEVVARKWMVHWMSALRSLGLGKIEACVVESFRRHHPLALQHQVEILGHVRHQSLWWHFHHSELERDPISRSIRNRCWWPSGWQLDRVLRGASRLKASWSCCIESCATSACTWREAELDAEANQLGSHLKSGKSWGFFASEVVSALLLFRKCSGWPLWP